MHFNLADWAMRLLDTEQYGFDRAATLQHFGYEIPPNSLHRIMVKCKCGKLSKATAGNFYCKNVSKNYQHHCFKCGAAKKEHHYSDWECRCKLLLNYDKEATYSQFGYEYPIKGDSLVCVKCRDCNLVFHRPIAELCRKRNAHIAYRCKRCMSKAEFGLRQEKMYKNLREFWGKEENREWASILAKSQGERRSKNMKALNQDPTFQALRTTGYNESVSMFYMGSKGEQSLHDYITSLGFTASEASPT